MSYKVKKFLSWFYLKQKIFHFASGIKYLLTPLAIHKVSCIYCQATGAKLAPFNSEGVCQNCPTKTDDALQQVFISGHYFSRKCWRAGGAGVVVDINKLN
jgi:hypothetical protein